MIEAKNQDIIVRAPPSLMSLPGELRNRIWRFLIVRDEPFPAFAKTGSLQHRAFVPWIAHTSRSIRHEVLSIYYSENSFLYDRTGNEIKDRLKMQQWLKTVMPFVRAICTYGTFGYSPPYARGRSHVERVLLQLNGVERREITQSETFVMHDIDSTGCVMYIRSEPATRGGLSPESIYDQQAQRLEGLLCRSCCFLVSRETGLLIDRTAARAAEAARKQWTSEAVAEAAEKAAVMKKVQDLVSAKKAEWQQRLDRRVQEDEKEVAREKLKVEIRELVASRGAESVREDKIMQHRIRILGISEDDL
ncbi:hypothetical protein B0A50_07360 [Salinomyces thailandicus]|uniref:Uncharacterized protein n=1 Tax=Salinomyces thailandicus TaxID=706561 RepID=A0A4U0TMU1_9PEZI|nr:hypothetical protein B0A50_07360 [Salinomyces thailandica]